MKAVLLALVASLRAGFRTRAALQLEVLALRHQLAVLQRCHGRARIKVADRLLWAWLSRFWTGWRDVLVFVRPSTVIAWQRRKFRDHWARLSQVRPGRPAVAKAVQDLIIKMSRANPDWGSPRIVGEHRSLAMDCPEPRLVQGPAHWEIVEVAEAGGLYRHYERRAA
jgi:putative transposase